MSWSVTWRDTADAYAIKKEDAQTERQVLDVIQQRLRDKARDISVTMKPPESDLGGVPFPEIIGAFKQKKVVPFLGAGVPFSGRQKAAEWHKGEAFLPSAAELARHLAFLCDLPIWNIRDTENLARVASYYTITNPGADLADELRAIFAGGSPTPVHELLAEPKLHPMLIVTTNYDTLMEQALEAKRVPYDTVIHCTDIDHRGCVVVKRYGAADSDFIPPTDFDVDLKTRTVLYKMHGSISRDTGPPQTAPSANFVITEEDYVTFLSRLSSAPPVVPPLFRTHFQNSSFLFLGYSLEDWNVRVILDSLNDVMSDNPSSARRPSKSKTVNSGITPSDFVQSNSKPISAPLPTRSGDPPPPPSSPVAQALKFQILANQGSVTSRRHWAIQHQPTSYDIEVWKGRRVVIRNMDLNAFVSQIRNPTRGLFP
jgi:hypothetical protein